jgi:hypothetical protein
MLIDEFLCKREVLGKRTPHSFTPPLSVVGVQHRAGHRESDDEKVVRYMNGLRYDIQDEMSMMTI